MKDGTRFIKHIPFSPLIFTNLKNQFQGKGVDVQLNKENQWIRIKKTENVSDEIKKAGDRLKEMVGVLSPQTIVEKEATMLKKAGFQVVVREVEEN
jgi:hypothetical protein